MPVANLETVHRLAELGGEGVVDALLYQQPVSADAGLPGVAVLGRDGALHRRFQVGVVKNDERRIATQLHRRLFHRSSALRQQLLADLSRAAPSIAAALPVTTLNTPLGTPPRSARSASANAERGVWIAGFTTMVQPAPAPGPPSQRSASVTDCPAIAERDRGPGFRPYPSIA